MTAFEFKAWFDGFSYGIDEIPTKEQWRILKEKIEEISVNTNQYQTAPLIFREPCQKNVPYKITCSSLLSDLSHDSTPSVF
jgi:hypothetical protein